MQKDPLFGDVQVTKGLTWKETSWMEFLVRRCSHSEQGQELSSGGDRVQGKPSVICNSAKHHQFLSSLNKKTGFHSNFVQADRSWQNF